MLSHPSGPPSKQGSLRISFRPIGFLVYINDLPNGLLSNHKLFADDTSIFSVVKYNLNSSNNSVKVFIKKVLSGHTSGKCHLTLMFPNKLKKIYNLPINRKLTQKHLDLFLDEKLNFSEHINGKPKR